MTREEQDAWVKLEDGRGARQAEDGKKGGDVKDYPI